MNTIEKSLIKTAKNAHNRCLYLQTYEKWICQVYERVYKRFIETLHYVSCLNQTWSVNGSEPLLSSQTHFVHTNAD